MMNIDRAPEFRLPEFALSQPIAWSKEEGFISLRQFIANRGPNQTREAFGISVEESTGYIKKVDELTPEELVETVCERLRWGTENTRIVIKDEGEWSVEEIIDQVKDSTGVGLKFLETSKRGIEFLERLIEKGKLIGPENFKLPDFPF